MSLPTLSRLPLAMACVGSQVLPTVEDAGGPEAAAGTAKHDFAAAVLAGRSYDEALEAAPEEHREGIEAVPWDIILPRLEGLSTEVAYAYDVRARTTRRLGRNLGRRYNQTQTEVAGALDFSSEQPAVYVDLKTGRGAQVPAAEHWQLRGGAVMLASLTGATEVLVGILLAREGSRPRWDMATIDALQLAEDADELEALADRIEVARGTAPPLRTGPHCTYCPARGGCPARTDLVRLVALDTPRAVSVGLLTREERTATYHRWRMAQSVLDEVKGQLIAAALVEPIEVEPGTLYGSHAVTRETLDGQAAADVLSSLYSPAVAALGVEISATKASVGRAVKAHVEAVKTSGGKATQAGCLRDVMAALAAAGGIEKTSATRVEEYPGELPPLLGDADAPPEMLSAEESQRVLDDLHAPVPSPSRRPSIVDEVTGEVIRSRPMREPGEEG